MSPYDPDALDRRDPRLISRVQPVMEAIAKRYFALRSEGEEYIPGAPAIFVANHNGGIMGPDLFCTLPVLWRVLGAESPLYALAHDFAMRQFSPLGRLLQRVGAVRACRANAEHVLAQNGQVLVYPGGDLEAYRTTKRMNEVVILPRTGFVEVARKMNVPIVPIVTQGAHRSAYIFTEGERIARALRMPYWARLQRFPLAFALPWGLALGPWLPYLPLPFPIRLRVLPPILVGRGEHTQKVALRVQLSMQSALDDPTRFIRSFVRRRAAIFFGARRSIRTHSHPAESSARRLDGFVGDVRGSTGRCIPGHRLRPARCRTLQRRAALSFHTGDGA
jgi:1-acyl-sn-glycerol-3-phosphate acyltransferase